MITASTANATMMSIEAQDDLEPSSSEIARMGPNSPIAPAPWKYRPNGVPSTPRSRRIGSSVPRAVLVRAMATATPSCTKPRDSSARTTTMASATDTNHPMTASRPDRPLIACWSSS